MASPAFLIEHIGQRIVRQKRMNVWGVFLPLIAVAALASRILFLAFSLPPLLVFSPVFLFCGLMIIALWRAKNSIGRAGIATLIDEKTNSQERFLTLVTVPSAQPPSPFITLLQRQAAEQAIMFHPEQAVPFKLEKKALLAIVGSGLCILALLFFPILPTVAPQASVSQLEIQPRDLEKLEEFARTLMRQGTTTEERTTGAQLLALTEQLKDPALSVEEKRHLIKEAQQRMNLPLPQIFPFDLQLFANKSKNDKGEGNENEQSPSEGQSPAKSEQNPDQLGQSPADASGNEPQPGSQKDGQKKEQSKPQESGGGIKFNLPQPQSGEKRDRTDQETPGQQQKSSQEPSPNSQAPGTDPNRPGGQTGQNQDPEKSGQIPQPQQTGREEKGKGSTVGSGKGERFLKPGEQPGGFLTKDARFVKVRIPASTDPQGRGDTLTENYDRAQPKTPYSNAPLKDAPPDHAQLKQPIPLEYRAILQK